MSGERLHLPDLTGVPALTLRNPWAHLIAHGSKRVENRTWLPPESLYRVLIHAGKAWAPEEDWHPLAGDVDGVETGAIVAVADVAHGCVAQRYSRTARDLCGPWALPLHVHWLLTDVIALPAPVPCKGRQALWRPAPDVLAAVRESLGGAS